LSPLPLFGHGAEVLFAKLSFHPASKVRVELTAQYGPDALLKDEPEAREVLLNTLRIATENSEHGGSDLKNLATASFTAPTKLDATAPPAYQTVQADDMHSMLCASWTWDASGETMTFCMPERTPHDVVLWTVPPDGEMEKAKQFYLISGDMSQPIRIPKAEETAKLKRPASGIGAGVLWFGALLVLVCGFVFMQRKSTAG
jgi:hypothetical protein